MKKIVLCAALLALFNCGIGVSTAASVEEEMRLAAITGGWSQKDMQEMAQIYKKGQEIYAEQQRQVLALSKEWTKQYPQNPKSFRQLTAQHLRFIYKQAGLAQTRADAPF